MSRFMPSGRKGWGVLALAMCWGIALAWVALARLGADRPPDAARDTDWAIPADVGFAARDRPADRVAGIIRAAAGAAGVSLDGLVPVAAGPEIVSLDLSVSGTEAKVRGFVAAVERARPAIRFREWEVRPEPGSSASLRFQARAVALVRQP